MDEQKKKPIAITILKYTFKVCCIVSGGKIWCGVLFVLSFIASIIYGIYNAVQTEADVGSAFAEAGGVFILLWIGILVLRVLSRPGAIDRLHRASETMLENAGMTPVGRDSPRSPMVYTVKVKDGFVEIYDASTGSFQRSIHCRDAVFAAVQGNVVAVNMRDGSTEIYDADTGSYQRRIL